MECTACSLYKQAINPGLLGIGEDTAKIMFLQDCIDTVDDKLASPFSGNSSAWLRRALENRGINPDIDVYFTSLVKCCCSEPDILSNANIYACLPYLESEIEIVNPDIIVPMGNFSLKFCLGRIGITKLRGNAQEATVCGKTRIILPILHPKLIPKKPAYKQDILKDLDTLKTVFTQGLSSLSNVEYKYLETLDEVRSELTRLNMCEKVVFDLETTGKSPYIEGAKIVCISLTDRERYGVVIPLYKHDSPFSPEQLTIIVAMIKLLMENPAVKKGAHNGKFDMEWLKVLLNINTQNFAFDTLSAHYIAISEEKGTQGLKSQAWEYTDIGGYDNKLDEYRNNLSDGEGLESRFNYDRIPWDILREYAAADADCCMRLWNLYEPLIQENSKWITLYNDIILPGTLTLMDVEITGMKINRELSSQYQEAYNKERDRILSRLDSYPEVIQIKNEKLELFKERQQIRLIPKKDRTPEEQRKFVEYKKYEDFNFNWSSVSHLKELLFDKLKLKTDILTEKGELSTSEESLEKMKDQHEIPKLLLELRKINTLNGFFIQKLSTLADSNDLIHSSYNMTGCITGDSLILTEYGLKYIKDIVGDTKDGEFIPNNMKLVNRYKELEEASHVVFYSKKPTIKIKTQLGFTLEGTYNHPVLSLGYQHFNLTNNSREQKYNIISDSKNHIWKELEYLTLDHLICIPFGQQIYGNYILKLPKITEDFQYPTKLTPDLAVFLGMLKGIGEYKNGVCSFQTKNEDIIRYICELSLKLFNTVAIVKNNNVVNVTSSVFPIWENKLQFNKTGIPYYILESDKSIQFSYIKGMYTKSLLSDSRNFINIKITSSDLEALKQLQLMLLNIGIVSSLTEDTKQTKSNYMNDSSAKKRHQLLISGNNYCIFRDTIGFIQTSYNNDYTYTSKYVNNYIVDNPHKVLWLRVKEIQKSNNDVYDFTVPGTHSFVSNGFISHNTVTGRLSSENPNLQQIPRKAPENPLLFQYHHEPKSLFTSRFGDNGVIMNADYCLAGDTKIYLVNHGYDTIKNIIDRINNGESLFTFSINPITKVIELSKILSGAKIRINEPTVKVLLDNKKFVICSYNHKFLTKKGTYVEAKDLTPHTELMPSLNNDKYNYIDFIPYRERLIMYCPSVVSVTPDKNMDLYDIEVENYHNFQLEAGIFVHNSALEMRIAAVISNDKKMSQAFLSGVDIHKSNAAYMYKIPIEEVTKDRRTLAKSLGFGILYGKSGATFAKDLYFDPTGKTEGKTANWEEAKRLGFDIIDHFLGTFKGVRKWLKDTKEFAYENGYVETMFGRRRRLPDLKSKMPRIRADAERQAINAPIQGTGSDFTMLSLIKINEWLHKNKYQSCIVATVHDSIVFDVYLPELPTLAPVVKQIMESVHKPYINTVIPIVSELELGSNYGTTFEVSLEEIVNISTQKEFSTWFHKNSLIKYHKEIEFFYKKNWGYKDVVKWLQDNNRPVKELVDFIVKMYSKD